MRTAPRPDPQWWRTGALDAQPMREILAARDIGSVFRFLGARGWSRAALAAATGLSETRVRQIRGGTQRVESYDVLQRIADGLGIPRGQMGLASGERVPDPLTCSAGRVSGQLTPYGPAGRAAVSLLTPTAPEAGEQPQHRHLRLWAPPGRFFPGLAIPAQVHPAVDDGRVLVAVPQGYRDDPFLHTPRRGLVIGQTDTAQQFGIDCRHARRRLRHAPPGARLLIPPAYLLDELSFAVLWAVANLDEALLADDGLLDECRPDVAGYEHLTRSAASRDLAADLTPAGRMWLGSAFCAGHIHRHAASLSDVPVFWTREQRGEEASTWLLFTHKHEYLRATAERFASTATRMARVFCVPRAAVEESPRGERILLLLAIALMESHNIQVVITDEPEYSGTTGFVSDRRRAIVANWVDPDGIWHVDVTDHQPTLREYTDAVDYAGAHSVIAAPTSRRRLRALSDFLELDWPWLQHRCRELAEHGCAGIAQPRSRHLSLAGVDRACRYLAGPDPATD